MRISGMEEACARITPRYRYLMHLVDVGLAVGCP
jgi:hypothetical protein